MGNSTKKTARKMNKRFKIFSLILALMLMVTEIVGYVPSVRAEDIQSVTEPGNAGIPENTNTLEPSIEPVTSMEPGNTNTTEPSASSEPESTGTPAPSASTEPGITGTPEPSTEPGITGTPEPSTEPGNTDTPKPSTTPVETTPRLKAVNGVSLSRYSTHAVKVTWEKHKKAKYYRVYYSKKKNGSGRLAGITKNTQYMVKKLKNNTNYYFYVVACKTKKASDSDSLPSEVVHIKTKTYIRKTIFAGDSITKGIMDYRMLDKFKMKGKKQVVAAIGLNTITFRTRRVFGGKSGLQKIIAEKPSRVYMMLGINEVNYRRLDDMLSDYKSMIQAIKTGSPDTDIVLCAISPVTRGMWTKYKGYSNLPVFNKKLEKLAKKTNTRYFDYTGFLKGPDGFLKTQYAARDGYHWIPSVYIKFADIVSKYDKSLDK